MEPANEDGFHHAEGDTMITTGLSGDTVHDSRQALRSAAGDHDTTVVYSSKPSKVTTPAPAVVQQEQITSFESPHLHQQFAPIVQHRPIEVDQVKPLPQ